MLWGGHEGGLEIRKRASGAFALHGRFPYNKAAVLTDGGRTGRPRKEVIVSRAFEYRVKDPNEDIHLLVGHDYGQPLASKKAGTLRLKDADDALTMEADITPEMQEVSWVKDFLAALFAGLIAGLSHSTRTRGAGCGKGRGRRPLARHGDHSDDLCGAALRNEPGHAPGLSRNPE